MRALYPTLPLQPDEMPTSLLSRLSRYHKASSVRSFCTDLGLAFQPIVDGDSTAIEQLAVLSGASFDTLKSHAYRATDAGWTLRGEKFIKSSLQRGVPRVCPECVSLDTAGAGRIPAAALPYGRAIWPILHIRACPVHELRLITPHPFAKAQQAHDFAGLLEPHLDEIERLAKTSPRISPSALEAYLIARLEGRRSDHPFLDGLDFSAAAQMCEVIGAVHIRGRKVAFRSLSDEQWQAAGAAGFAIASQGEEAIRKWLADQQLTYPYTRSANEGPQAVFGRFYTWLAFSAPHSSFDAIRELVRTHAIETMPLGPDDLVFGKPVEKRRLHSIRTASLELGAHPKRMRKILAARGIIREALMLEPDNRVLFDAEAIVGLVAEGVFNGMPLAEVSDYINAPRPHPDLLLEAGLITPVVSHGEAGLGDYAFTTKELDRFLNELLQDAEPTPMPLEGKSSLLTAAKRANCSAIEIVHLILARKLAWVGRLPNVAGYLSVLVDINEIKNLVQKAPLPGFTARNIERELKTSTKVVTALIAQKFFRPFTMTHPINRCPVQIVPRDQLKAFQARFVSLTNLAAERGLHFRIVSAELEAAGVRPALDKETYGATFYSRSDLDSSLLKFKRGRQKTAK